MAARHNRRLALESLAVVRAQVYTLPTSGNVNVLYRTLAAFRRTRLAQAGLRLAWMLDERLRNSTLRDHL
jgi:hypothetical protein